MSSDRRTLLCLSVGLAVLFGLLVFLTRFKWGDPIIDTGRELEVPWKISLGSVLYRDMAYNYGPLSPHLNALFLKVFGVRLNAIVLSGILSAGLGMVLVYLASRIFLDRLASAGLAAVFLFECAFQHYYPNNNFNFILPYSFPAVHGILAALGAVILLARHLDTGKRAPMVGAGLLAGIGLLCKVEIAAALIVPLALAPVLKGKGCKRAAGETATWFVPFLLVTVLGFAPFIAASSFRQVVWENVFKPQLVDIRSSVFFMERLGVAGFGENMIRIVKSLGLWALFVAVLGAAPKGRMPAALFAAAGAAALWFLLPYDLEFRGLPVVAAAVLTACSLAAFRKKKKSPHDLKLTVFSLFALLCLARILFFAGTEHYGFCLALPGVILFAVFLLRILPQWIPLLARAPRFYAAAVLVVLVALSARNFFIDSWGMYEGRRIEIEGPNGRMRVGATPLNMDFKDTLDHLKEKGEPGDTLLVLPEGATLNFLSGQPNPTYYDLFIPPELNAPGVEEDVIARIEKAEVTRIVVLNRPVFEYGYRGLGRERGKDYGVDLMTYVHERYEKEDSFQTPSVGRLPPGGSVIYRRKSASRK